MSLRKRMEGSHGQTDVCIWAQGLRRLTQVRSDGLEIEVQMCGGFNSTPSFMAVLWWCMKRLSQERKRVASLKLQVIL